MTKIYHFVTMVMYNTSLFRIENMRKYLTFRMLQMRKYQTFRMRNMRKYQIFRIWNMRDSSPFRIQELRRIHCRTDSNTLLRTFCLY